MPCQRRGPLDLARLQADICGLHEAHPTDHTACALAMVKKAVAGGQGNTLVLLADCVRNAHLVHELEGRQVPWLLAAAEELEAHSIFERACMRLHAALQLCTSAVTMQTTRCVSHCTRGT